MQPRNTSFYRIRYSAPDSAPANDRKMGSSRMYRRWCGTGFGLRLGGYPAFCHTGSCGSLAPNYHGPHSAGALALQSPHLSPIPRMDGSAHWHTTQGCVGASGGLPIDSRRRIPFYTKHRPPVVIPSFTLDLRGSTYLLFGYHHIGPLSHLHPSSTHPPTISECLPRRTQRQSPPPL